MARELILRAHGYRQIVRFWRYSENIMWYVLWYLMSNELDFDFITNLLRILTGGGVSPLRTMLRSFPGYPYYQSL